MFQDEVAKENYSWYGIVIWCIFGGYAIYTGKIEGVASFLLYFSVGIFIASASSVVNYFLMKLMVKIFVATQISANIAQLITYLLLIINALWTVFVAQMFLRLLNNLF